jgi:Skp family chaperone for outer membrane proteins
VNNHSHKKNFLNIKNSLKISNNIENNKIGIVDFRYILKSSNAMKLLGNKFLTLEEEINEKIKQKQIFLKQKEENLKKSKGKLTELEYKKRVKLFKKEVFKIQKKYKDDRAVLNRSFQKIQKNIKDLLAQIIKDVSINKKINVVLLKENVFLFNNQSIDFTNEVLELFNTKTKSMKIIINSPK